MKNSSLNQSAIKKNKFRNFNFIKGTYVKIAYGLNGFLQQKNKKFKSTCLNLGLVLPENENLSLSSEDEIDRIYFQLYYYVCKRVSFKDKEVLETGCGVGGGTYFINKYFKPSHIKAIDLIGSLINIAKKRYSETSITFKQGDSCKLKEAPLFYDIALDIESSHSYVDFTGFLSRIYSTLKVGGSFIFADIRYAFEIKRLESDFCNQGFTIKHKENISNLVLNALDISDDVKREVIGKTHPFYFFIKGFAFLKDSNNYKILKEGEIVFMHYVLSK